MPKRTRTPEPPPRETPAVGSLSESEQHSKLPLLPQKNRAAAELGRRGGKKGGAVRAARMTPEERAAASRRAAVIRWAKPPADLTDPDGAKVLEGDVIPPGAVSPPSPFAKWPGTLDLAGTPVDVYVLDTGERVMILRSVVKVLTGIDGGVLEDYIGVKALKPFIDSGLVLEESIDFYIPGTQFRGRGITAEQFEAILTGYVKALHAGALTTDRQREIAIRCAILSTSFLRVGIIAQIDEATGYQYARAEDALQIKLRAFIADELRDWEKTFPDELWEQFGRLTKWQGSLHSRPKWWGKLVMELIYDALDPDIADYLRRNKPKPYHGQNYHQWLTQDVGLKALIPHIYEIIGIAKTCHDMRELRDKVAEHYGNEPMQMTLYLPKKR